MEGPKIEEVLTYLDENFDNDLKAVQDQRQGKVSGKQRNA